MNGRYTHPEVLIFISSLFALSDFNPHLQQTQLDSKLINFKILNFGTVVICLQEIIRIL